MLLLEKIELTKSNQAGISFTSAKLSAITDTETSLQNKLKKSKDYNSCCEQMMPAMWQSKFSLDSAQYRLPAKRI